MTEFARLDEGVAFNKQVYDYLKRAIIECRLMPGDTVSEHTVAGRFKFQISRQPVREALIKLAQNGFVVIHAKKSTRVARISRGEIQQGGIIRRAIECRAAELCAMKAADEILDRLELNVQDQRYVAEQYNMNKHFALDDDFHRLILEAAGLPRAWEIVERFKGSMDRVRFLALEHEMSPISQTSSAHAEICDALRRHDPEMAAQAMGRHVDVSRESIESVMARCNPDWFTD